VTRPHPSSKTASHAPSNRLWPVADSHMHLFPRGYHPRPDAAEGIDISRYEALRERHGIFAALVIGYQGEGIDPHNNAYIRVLAADRPWMTTVAHLPVSPAPTQQHLESLFEAGHKGIGLHCLNAASAAAVTQWPRERWAHLEHQGALVSLNSTPEAQPGLQELVRTRPGCRFLFAHLGQPGRYWQKPTATEAEQRLSPLLTLSDLSNCWVKISALYAISGQQNGYPYSEADPFVTVLLNAFGPSKCLWGSDFSPTLDHGTFDQALQVTQLGQLSPAERNSIMGINLQTLIAV